MGNLNTLFKSWCKETGRSGGVLVGKSIREFFDWVESKFESKSEKEIPENVKRKLIDKIYNTPGLNKRLLNGETVEIDIDGVMVQVRELG